MDRISSLSEKPRVYKPRRLADWLNPTNSKKVHSLVDKVYKQKNLELAWAKVKQNKGSGGIDGENIEQFESNLLDNLTRLHRELSTQTYHPKPVKQQLIPKGGQANAFRILGIPTIYDRVCQQALLNRLEPIFEPVFDEASFGYRPGRSTKDALRKVWQELKSGREWVLDADLKDFFGSVEHEKLKTLFSQRISDGRVLRLILSIIQAGYISGGKLYSTDHGLPQGSPISPLASNVLLTPFDRSMRNKGYFLTRFADDWVVTCTT